MEVFKPIKVENYQFMDSGLDQYEPLLLYIKEGKVYFVKNKFDDKLREWVDNNLIIEGRGRAFIDRSYGKIAINVDTQDLENSIAELSAEEGFRKIELKNEREKKRRVYNLMRS